MRTFGFALSALLVAAVAASAQVTTIQVLQPPLTDLQLGPRTLNTAIVSCTDLPTTTAPTSPYWIVAAQAGTNHLQYAPGEIVVLNGGTGLGYMAGQRFYIRRLQVGLYGEQPSDLARGAIRTAGWLTVVATDVHSTLARIDYACDAISAGDYLDPFVETKLPAAALEGPPNFTDLARVLFGADRRQTFAAGDVLSIDRGQDRGVTMGTRVSFYRDRLNGTPLVEMGAQSMADLSRTSAQGDRESRPVLPLVEMGAGVVVAVSTDSAKVVVVRARDAVILGDYVVFRGAAAP